MLPAMGETPPVKEWGLDEVAIDLFHHLVYITVFAGAWYVLSRDDRPWWRRLIA